MSKLIDCLFIGQNEMEFRTYENMVRSMGVNSAAYRDLNLNFVQYQKEKLSVADLYNRFYHQEGGLDKFSLGQLLSPAIAYLGTYLHRRNFSFDYVNSFQTEKASLAEKLQQNNIRTIAIITTLYVSVLPILEVVAFIKKHNTTAKIIIGGPFISSQIRMMDTASLQYLFKSMNADFYVNSSQGEATLVKIIEAVKNNLSFALIPNISYKEGKNYLTTRIELEDNKLADNTVDWNLFAGKLGKFAAVRTAISCPFSCAFCGFPQHAGKYQCVDVSAVEQELNAIEAMGTVRSLNFIDDTLNVPADRFKELLKMMIRNKYTFKWNSHYRCQFADRETIELMKESGCEGVFLGIESGNPAVLTNMKKAATIEKYRYGLELLNEYGIVSYASFIIGFPGENEASVKDTVNFIEEMEPTYYRTQLWYCDRITPIWQEREKYDIRGSQFEWSHATMDAKTASDIIDGIFLKTRKSIWIPQYNFEFSGIFTLLHQGLNLQQINEFLTTFNQGVKEKLNGQTELSSELVQSLKTGVKEVNT